MNKIDLSDLQLKIFTEQNVLDYCQINNINLDDITELDLSFNQLTDISGIRLFKNIKKLHLWNNRFFKDISKLKDLKNLKFLDISSNQITDISVLKNLNKLEVLDINNLELESNQIKHIKSLNNLEKLYCRKAFKDMSVLKQLNKNINIVNE